MTESSKKSVTLHQCLFGYDEGHRLLSSSISLPSEIHSSLLLKSDLIPSPRSISRDGYWTGIPVPSMKCYALMRTWLAPEMPRPGCVWTQVVLIHFFDIARISDLEILTTFFSRPNISESFDSFSKPITFSLGGKRHSTGKKLLLDDAINIVKSAYAPKPGIFYPSNSSSVDSLVFALWSQQWPRLRRSFSFRTAAYLSTSPDRNLQVSLSVFRGEPTDISLRSTAQDWALFAAHDLIEQSQSDFRRFIWRYGSDVRFGARRYRFLTKLFISSRKEFLGESEIGEILQYVFKNLPDPIDGKILKEDLLSCGYGEYSLFPRANALSLISEALRLKLYFILPLLSPDVWDSLVDSWEGNESKIFYIVESCLSCGVETPSSVLTGLAFKALPSEFLRQSANTPNARKVFAETNPQLLDCAGIESLPVEELHSLLDLLPSGDSNLLERVTTRLVNINNTEIAELAFNKAPEACLLATFRKISKSISGSEKMPAECWISQIKKSRSESMITNLLRLSQSDSELSSICYILNFDISLGAIVNISRWGDAVKSSNHDISAALSQKLNVFLLTLALSRPHQGSEAIFKATFDKVHHALANSMLTYSEYLVIEPFFPRVSWWNSWDDCQKLRQAVVDAFVDNWLSAEVFRKLSDDLDTQDILNSLARDTKRGRNYLS